MTGASISKRGILVLVAGYPPAYLGGGPIRTIEAMVEKQAGDNPTQVLTSGYDHGCTEPLDVPLDQWVSHGRAKVYYGDLATRKGKMGIVRSLKESDASVLYVNSLFNTWFSVIPMLLRRLGRVNFDTVVVAPRGELDPGALGRKTPKKRLFLGLARLMGLYRGVLWHASSDLEAANIRTAFTDAQVLVKENETLVRPRESADLELRDGPVRFAYLGRVSPKKRVHLLIEAAAELPAACFELTVHGGGDEDYVRHCRALARKLEVPATFGGAVQHHEVAAVFDAVDFACFPTAGENFGHVIAEAMSRGCPVVVGDVTPWTERVRGGGGVVVPNHADPISWAKAMYDALSEDSSVRRGRRIAALAAFKAWDSSRPDDSFLDHLRALER